MTPDEILYAGSLYIIQESKNSTRRALPELSDIQDGLFKLILYSNIDSLQLNRQQVSFSTKLKLTGIGIRDCIVLPCTFDTLEEFLSVNSMILNKREQAIIRKLLLEVQHNSNIEIEIRAND